MGIFQCHLNFSMPHQLFNSDDRCSLQGQPTAKSMAEGMEHNFITSIHGIFIEPQPMDCPSESITHLPNMLPIPVFYKVFGALVLSSLIVTMGYQLMRRHKEIQEEDSDDLSKY